MIESVVLYWILGSLITMLLIFHLNRVEEDIPINKYGEKEWEIFLIGSFLFPVIWLCFSYTYLFPFLIKERKFNLFKTLKEYK